MSDIKLKACPFCGGEAGYYRHGKNLKFIGVRCPECCDKDDYLAPGQAAEAWNRRADDWISVEDESPDNGEVVLAHFGGDVYMCRCNADIALYAEAVDGRLLWEGELVMHWRRLPSPPRIEEQK